MAFENLLYRNELRTWAARHRGYAPEAHPGKTFAQPAMHHAAGNENEPIVDAGEDREDASDSNNQVEIREDEGSVVQVGRRVRVEVVNPPATKS